MNPEEVETLTKEEKINYIEKGHLFCWKTFWTGIAKKVINFIFSVILSREFLVFVIFSVAFFDTTTKQDVHWIVYGCVAGVFIFAEALRILIAYRTNLNLSGNAGVNKTLQESR
jgi:uncharacterized membrane protein YhfC